MLDAVRRLKLNPTEDALKEAMVLANFEAPVRMSLPTSVKGGPWTT